VETGSVGPLALGGGEEVKALVPDEEGLHHPGDSSTEEGVWVPQGAGILGTAEPHGGIGSRLPRGNGSASSLPVPQEAVALNLHWTLVSNSWVVGGLHLKEGTGGCAKELEILWSPLRNREISNICCSRGLMTQIPSPAVVGRMVPQK